MAFKSADVLHTHIHTQTYWDICTPTIEVCRKQKSSPHMPYCSISVWFLSFYLSFLSFSLYPLVFLYWLSISPSLPFFYTLPSVQDGKSSCPWLPQQCLMECRSLWPLAVCLCTSCTCPCLKSNSTTHIQSLSHSVRHTNTHTYVWL